MNCGTLQKFMADGTGIQMSLPERNFGRGLRVDAMRNREAILLAAQHIFAEERYNVPMSVIASAAGVGRATLLRNFPTRLELAYAVFDRSMETLRNAVARHTGEPGEFEKLLDLKLEVYARNGALAAAVQRESEVINFSAEFAEVAQMFLAAARSAAAAGLLREDFDSETFLVLQQAIGGVMQSGGSLAERRARGGILRTLLLDGLRKRPADVK